jgi:hypothetical protein
MYKPDFNTLQFSVPYYVAQVRDPKYANIQFVPNIYVTRINSKQVKIFVKIMEYNVKTQKAVAKKTVEYLENVDNQEDYFRSLQNSNFEFGLPSPLLFLEKFIEGLNSIVQGKTKATAVSYNCIPTQVFPLGAKCDDKNNKNCGMFL